MYSLSIPGDISAGWDFFPWNVWSQKNTDTNTIVPQKSENRVIIQEKKSKIFGRNAKQSFSGTQKEIIDLEETVCLPRYQCGRTKSTSATLYNLAFTDQLNTQTVCITFSIFW